MRQERPNAMDHVQVHEGNLERDNLGYKEQDRMAMKNVNIVFHAAGPSAKLLEFCQGLPFLQAVVVAGDIFRLIIFRTAYSTLGTFLPIFN